MDVVQFLQLEAIELYGFTVIIDPIRIVELMNHISPYSSQWNAHFLIARQYAGAQLTIGFVFFAFRVGLFLNLPVVPRDGMP